MIIIMYTMGMKDKFSTEGKTMNYIVCSKCGDEFKTDKKSGWCEQCVYEAVQRMEVIRELNDASDPIEDEVA